MNATESRTTQKRATTKGETTRAEILTIAVDLASREGLEGLTIGHLAEVTKMSKSGLFAHFGSKTDLQLAVIRAASKTFNDRVVAPSFSGKHGLERLRKMISNWLKYLETLEYSGGCFFTNVTAEFDDRHGPVRDEIARLAGGWLTSLIEQANEAKAQGELKETVDPVLLGYQLHAMVQEANFVRRLMGWDDAYERAREAVEGIIGRSPR